jgi:hypothetical protein
MNEYRRQSDFLKHLLAMDDSPSSRTLHERLVVAERNERCLFGSCRLVALIGVVGILGFGYTAVLLPEFFNNSTHVLIRLFSALGLGSAICLIVFAGVWLWYRATADRVREDCRLLIVRMLAARLRPEVERTGPVIHGAPSISMLPPVGRPASSPGSEDGKLRPTG